MRVYLEILAGFVIRMRKDANQRVERKDFFSLFLRRRKKFASICIKTGLNCSLSSLEPEAERKPWRTRFHSSPALLRFRPAKMSGQQEGAKNLRRHLAAFPSKQLEATMISLPRLNETLLRPAETASMTPFRFALRPILPFARDRLIFPRPSRFFVTIILENDQK